MGAGAVYVGWGLPLVFYSSCFCLVLLCLLLCLNSWCEASVFASCLFFFRYRPWESWCGWVCLWLVWAMVVYFGGDLTGLQAHSLLLSHLGCLLWGGFSFCFCIWVGCSVYMRHLFFPFVLSSRLARVALIKFCRLKKNKNIIAYNYQGLKLKPLYSLPNVSFTITILVVMDMKNSQQFK